MMGAHHSLTDQQERFLAEHAPHMSRAELTEMFNEEFRTRFAVSTVKSWCNKRGLSNGNDGRFHVGDVSWQTGLHGDAYKCHYTQESWSRSKSGLIRYEQKHKIGDVYIRHGSPVIYMSDTGRGIDVRIVYASKYVWEQANGELPDDRIIVHLDGDIMNYCLDNLIAIPRSWLPDLRRVGGLTNNKDLNFTKLKYCRLRSAIRALNRK